MQGSSWALTVQQGGNEGHHLKIFLKKSDFSLQEN